MEGKLDMPVGTEEEAREQKITFVHILKALLREPVVLPAVIFLLILLIAALFAQFLAPYDPLLPNIFHGQLPPLSYAKGTDGSLQFHLLGTDALGRDLLSRLMYGAQASVAVGVIAVLISSILGTSLGLLAGYYGGWLETVVMRAADGFMAVPSLLVAMFVLFIAGGGLVNMVLVLAAVRWVVYARLARGITLSYRESSFVEAARTIGAGDARIMFRHILPNMVSPLLVLATLEVALMILAEAGLSYLGFGLQPPEPSWGLMIARGREYLREAWWMITFPGLAIFLTTLSLNLLANWVRAISDPVQRWRWLI
ncbi:ABC transporter permease [Hoeflea prorocentri]|uniref:ABC transporter permease n=1 Tax=Hoeflea prorocentri TaxID=1922333 RepID=A0A9X3ULW8_9HYPH|nr:ABC transporter permease [Hoeflea prorocentri]MCY6383032.1 ABC transporter permease [Hoeflea prorocentri]MDA5400832.1 ABC transporter permease [Hoeflea prorocentri]